MVQVFDAIDHGDLSGMLEVINTGLDINQSPYINGRTSLWKASASGALGAAKLLLKHGASLNKADSDGRTPLYAACQNDNTEMARLLVDAGAEPNEHIFFATLKFAKFPEQLELKRDSLLRDQFGRTPAYFSAIYGHASLWTEYCGQKLTIEPVQQREFQPRVPLAYGQPTLEEEVNRENENLEPYGVKMEKKLGSGSFGDVWKGKMDARDVAIKFLQTTDKRRAGELREETSLLGYCTWVSDTAAGQSR